MENKVFKKVCQILEQSDGEFYVDRLKNALAEYETFIQSLNFNNKEQIKNSVSNTIKKINDIVGYYMSGKISSAYIAFDRWWFTSQKQEEDTDFHTEPKPTKDLRLKFLLKLTLCNKDNETFKENWYRIRKKEGPALYKIKDMFHVPFEMRGKIGNNRYSLSGYPCLYLGKSILDCWQEMNAPALSDCCISAFRFKSTMKVLDFRLRVVKANDLNDYLQILPLIIACSIPVPARNVNDIFHPEYIFPQFIMHGIVKGILNHIVDIDGIIYTSTKYNLQVKFKVDLFDNLAIPVNKIQKKGFCSYLKNNIELTAPKCYENEMLLGNISVSQTQKYEDTIFGQMEKGFSDFQNII